MRRAVVLSILALILAWPVAAVQPDEMLADPVLEARARDISKGLRCLVCQNQSIDDSNAGLARDLRILVRQRLTAGDSNDAVVAFVVDRYGDFVLLRPPVQPTTYVLWFGPGIVLLLAVFSIVFFFRRRSRLPVGASPLNDDERRRVEELTGDD